MSSDAGSVERTRRHLLCDLLLIALCASLAGAEGFCDMAEWAQTKEGWLRTFLDLPCGIPSHDTFARVFRHLDPQELHACFLRWIESFVGGGKHLAIDGKTLRRSFDAPGGERALHVVSAFAADGLGLLLGQMAVDDKSNEITAIPELLRLRDLQDAPSPLMPWAATKPSPRRSSPRAATTCWLSRATIRCFART